MMGLPVNEDKTKYMLSTSRDVRRIDCQADNYASDTGKEFIFLDAAVTSKIIKVWRSRAGSLLTTGATRVQQRPLQFDKINTSSYGGRCFGKTGI